MKRQLALAVRTLAVVAVMLLTIAATYRIVKISDYPNTASLNGTDVFVIGRPGSSTNYNITWTQLQAIIPAGTGQTNRTDVAPGSANVVVSTNTAGGVSLYSVDLATNITVNSLSATYLYATNWPAEAIDSTNIINQTIQSSDLSTTAVDSTNVIDGTLTAADMNASTLVSTNISMPSLTVATLPASPEPGQSVWCSDVVTSWGTGDTVTYVARSSGTNWLTNEGIVPTADVLVFMHRAAQARLVSQSRMHETFFWDDLSAGVNTGTSGGASISTSDQGRVVWSVSTGTGATGYGAGRAPWTTEAAGVVYVGAGSIYIPTLSTPTEEYRIMFGAINDSSVGNSGNYFLYDRTNTLGFGITGSNNWHCVSRAASTPTIVDSSVIVPEDTWINIDVVYTTTNATFYLNDSPIVTNTANLPTTADLYWVAAWIVKTNGTSNRYLYADWLYASARYPTNR